MISCNLECNKRAWCTNFFLGTGPKAGICFPYEAGCTKAYDKNVKYYQKLNVLIDGKNPEVLYQNAY